MKKLLLALALFTSLSLEAQFVTTLAKNAGESQSDGVMYYLPRNVIRLEFTIEETDYLIGPYAEFSADMLGAKDYIRENKSEVNIKSVDIQTITEIDPNAAYVIAIDERSKEPMPNIMLNADGIILALGYENIPSEYKIERKSLKNNDLETSERVEASFIEILDSEVELDDDDDDDEEEGHKPKKITKEDKANVALEHISSIRNAYFELISGAQEVAYGSTTKYMAKSLKDLENEYVSLFKGKIVKNVYKKVVYVTPESNQLNTSLSIGKLTNKGENVKIQFDSHNSEQNISLTSDEIRNSAQTNKVFYRIPFTTNVKVISGSTVIAEKALIISQFGDIRPIAAKNSKVLFNPNTGQIISITK